MFNKSTFIIRCGRIESRIRRLVTALETRPEILVAHPLIDGVSSEHLGLSYEEIQDVAYNDSIPNRFSSSPINDEVNEKPNDSEGKLYTTKFYIGLLLRRTYGTFGKVFSNLELRIIFNSHFIRHSQNYRLDRSYQTFYPS
jgi:poly(A) polymerase Pap1